VSDPLSQRPDPPTPTEQEWLRPVASSEHHQGDEVSLLRVANTLLKRWRTVVFVPLAAGIVTAAISFAVRPTFTATSSFVPEARSSARLTGGVADIAGLASQFGLSLGAEGSQSPRFYAELARSRQTLEHLLVSRFPNVDGRGAIQDSTTLVRSLQVSGKSFSDSLELGVRKLRARLSVKVDNPTSIVTVSVEVGDPDLAANVTNSLVGYLNDFNSQVRQSQARERRKFVEQRVKEGEDDLREVEEQLRRFYEANRSWQQAPQLVFEEGRLRRQVEIRQNVYLTLRREYESARIEEVNDIPLITVIDRAVPPVRRSWPKRSLLVVLALVLGFVMASMWAFSADYMDRARTEARDDYVEFKELLARMRLELSRLIGRSKPRQRV